MSEIGLLWTTVAATSTTRAKSRDPKTSNGHFEFLGAVVVLLDVAIHLALDRTHEGVVAANERQEGSGSTSSGVLRNRRHGADSVERGAETRDKYAGPLGPTEREG